MNSFLKLFFIALTFASVNSAWAFNKYICQCKATAPGYEETNSCGGVDKICSYSCNCIAWDETLKNGKPVASQAVPNISLNLNKLATTASSYETWDIGNHVCHGQYSYKSSLSDPNWKIQVKFDTFTLNSDGDVFYNEDASREIALGVRQVGFKYSKKAKELSDNISSQLKGISK